ncbi:uncharacterized protein [Parasteatoda tepidariorum]|uniref:uncharacterized protein n=1 Tax=Parasteatoda tepidariorum TaxID=114398 RepID=UPI00077FBBFA|nr:uncharacterized protein LOC107457236 [Parasteatoda tepidariorum]
MYKLILSAFCLIFVAGIVSAGDEDDIQEMKQAVCIDKDDKKIQCLRELLVPITDAIVKTECSDKVPVCGKDMETKLCDASIPDIKMCCDCLMEKLTGEPKEAYMKTNGCFQ